MPVCVFDLDQTLTAGSQASLAVQRCQERGFDLAINTARPHPWLEPELAQLGLPLPHSPAFVHNPHSYEQTSAERAAFKAHAMDRLAAHFQTSQLVLFDDLPENVQAAQRAGYHAQLVGRAGVCGIAEPDLAVLETLAPPSTSCGGRPR